MWFPFVIASLALLASPLCSKEPIYNYPLEAEGESGLFTNVSFIYWQPVQSDMELGFSGYLISNTVLFTDNVTQVQMNFDYKPGFKVSLGKNFAPDNWDLSLEYTWFHNTHVKTFYAAPGTFLLPNWGDPILASLSASQFAKEVWNLEMNLIDFELGRASYVGSNFTLRPNFALRADWIRQKVSFISSGMVTSGDTEISDTSSIEHKCFSWGIGPKMGLDTSWLIGLGFHLFGNGEADLLFTEYTTLFASEFHSQAASVDGLSYAAGSAKEEGLYVLVPHFDISLGLGWGTAFRQNHWHTDLSLGYEFQVFIDQDRLREEPQNLYIQGLTAKFNLEF